MKRSHKITLGWTLTCQQSSQCTVDGQIRITWTRQQEDSHVSKKVNSTQQGVEVKTWIYGLDKRVAKRVQTHLGVSKKDDKGNYAFGVDKGTIGNSELSISNGTSSNSH
jgi:hypothetical protein